MRDPSGERAIGEPRKSLAWNPGSKVREKRTTGVVRGLGAGRNHPQAAAPVTRTASAQGTTARPGARGRCSPVVGTAIVAGAGRWHRYSSDWADVQHLSPHPIV